MNPIVPIDEDTSKFTRTASNDGPVVGQWYWVLPEAEEGIEEQDLNVEDETKPEKWLACAMAVGSNYVLLESPHNSNGYRSFRLHLDQFWMRLIHEPDAAPVIHAKIAHHQAEAQGLMAEVQALTQRLGFTPQQGLKHGSASSAGQSTGLAVLSDQADVKSYGRELVLAKEKLLPELFKAIAQSHNNLATWMKAPSMPMIAMMAGLKESTTTIDDRIFTVGLYAGLAENTIQCCGGAPAAAHEKLHVFQRMAFADEEALLKYNAGGMTFANMAAFDAWLCEPQNRDRILPFPRSLVAMRVRRNVKERDSQGSMLRAFINFRTEATDKYTFLYIRNGEQVHRLDCEMEFGEKIFPDQSMYDPLEPKMVQMSGNRVREMMATSEYEVLLEKHREVKALRKAWLESNPEASDWDCPHSRSQFRPSDWKPIDHSNVMFDDCLAHIAHEVNEMNRVAVIIQGLYDRSMVLHPHVPVQSWHADGFDKAITLVYDASNVLHHGEAPDFEAYRSACNASLKTGSITTGQDEHWQIKEAQKESDRIDRDWRNKSEYRPTKFRPHGNPGPGLASRVAKWSAKSQQASFSWERKKAHSMGREFVNCHLEVPASELFNISAYTPGDYLLFFADPRTRAQYLKWAPLLLTAEDFHAGKAIDSDHG